MSRYIDAEVMEQRVREAMVNSPHMIPPLIKFIRGIPTADVAFVTPKEHFADVGKMVEPSPSKNDWIDAKIDKPKNGLARVLVCVDGAEIIGFPKIDTDRCIEGEWVRYGSHVTHWMPLPVVLISIRPKWCELIASGKKTIEVRKTAPKLPTPFECYIYCTKDPKLSFWRSKTYAYADDRSHNMFDIRGNGKVIGEFVCDNIDTYDDDTIFSFRYEDYARWNDFDLNRACIHPEDFQNYADGKWLYGWHISDLEIYDNPRELRDFGKARAPQSWCYVDAE